MAENRNTRKKTKPDQVVEWDQEDHVVRYANQLVVQFTQSEAHLSFFEIRPPIPTTDVSEHESTRVVAPSRIKANCVARIIVSQTRIDEFLKAIARGLEHVKKGIEEAQTATQNKNS